MLPRMLVPMAVALVSSGCVHVLEIHKEQLAPVHRVAIVGLRGDVRLSDHQGRNDLTATIAAAKNITDFANGKRGERRFEQAAIIYDDVATKFGAAFNWQVLPRAELGRSPLMQQLASGVHNFPVDVQHLPEVSTMSYVNGVGPQGAADLAAQLGVDATLTLNLEYHTGKTGGFAIAGMGSTTMYPQAWAHLKVVDARGALLWEDYQAVGRVAKEGLRTTMGAESFENETPVLTEAAGTAVDALLARYRAYQGP